MTKIAMPVRKEYFWPDTYNGVSRWSVVDANDQEVVCLALPEDIEEIVADQLCLALNNFDTCVEALRKSADMYVDPDKLRSCTPLEANWQEGINRCAEIARAVLADIDKMKGESDESV